MLSRIRSLALGAVCVTVMSQASFYILSSHTVKHLGSCKMAEYFEWLPLNAAAYDLYQQFISMQLFYSAVSPKCH